MSYETRIFHKFAFDNKALKHSSNFESAENIRSSNVVEFKLELRHIPSRFESIFNNYSYCQVFFISYLFINKNQRTTMQMSRRLATFCKQIQENNNKIKTCSDSANF